MSITIVCRTPGMRRNGVKHPARQTYADGHWSDEQLDAFEADAEFEVIRPNMPVTADAAAGSGDAEPSEPAKPEPSGAERGDAIAAAVEKLADADWTKSGRPRVAALEDILGWKPTADELEGITKPEG